jgi:hypothetical protein
MNPTLSRDGYGLGRLQAMADGGVAGYAAGGMTGGGASGMNSSLDRSSPLGQKYYGPKTGGLFEPIRDTNVLIEDAPDTFLSARFSGPGKSITMAELFSKIMPENEKLRQYVLSGPSFRSASPAMQGGDLNLNTASGLGETRLTDTNNAQVQYQPHVGTFLNNPSNRSELRTGYAKGGDIDYSKKQINLNTLSGLSEDAPISNSYSTGFNPDVTLKDVASRKTSNPYDVFSALSRYQAETRSFPNRLIAPDTLYNEMMVSTPTKDILKLFAKGGYLDGPGDGMSD